MIIDRPPMGWNSWNTFGPDINEKVVMETADYIESRAARGSEEKYRSVLKKVPHVAPREDTSPA